MSQDNNGRLRQLIEFIIRDTNGTTPDAETMERYAIEARGIIEPTPDSRPDDICAQCGGEWRTGGPENHAHTCPMYRKEK